MSHWQQQEFFKELSKRFSPLIGGAERILEVGSQNINGTVRPFFPSSAVYIGIDLGLAKDVDWVIPGELIELPDGWADIVVTTECLEHCENWEKALMNMIRILKHGGLLVVTCASIGRAAHGTLDSEEASSPYTASYYKNLAPDDITEKIKIHHYFDKHCFEVENSAGDLYFWGVRSALEFCPNHANWMSVQERLARAQGQLAQAGYRHAHSLSVVSSLKKEAEQARSEAEQARSEAEQARSEAEQARSEAEQARSEAEQARSEAEQARSEAERARSREGLESELVDAREESRLLLRQLHRVQEEIEYFYLENQRKDEKLHWLRAQRELLLRMLRLQGRFQQRLLALNERVTLPSLRRQMMPWWLRHQRS